MPRRTTLAIALLALSAAMFAAAVASFSDDGAAGAQRHHVGDGIGFRFRVRQRLRDRPVAGGHHVVETTDDPEGRRPWRSTRPTWRARLTS